MNKINQKLFDFNQFERLTAVQAAVLEHAHDKKRDLIVQAETGTGKTHAFLFTLLENIDPDLKQTQAFIIAPTRELAMQIADFAKPIMDLDDRYSIYLAIGGMDGERLSQRLAKNPQIIIATPGKLLDLLKQNILRLDTVRFCILDEMDMILDYGFLPDIDMIARYLSKDVRYLLFSATYPSRLKSFFKKYLRHPLEIKTSEVKLAPQIEHILINQRHRDPNDVVLDIINHLSPLLAIIFTNTIKEADELYAYLRSYDVSCLLIHGDLETRRRRQILKQIQSGAVRYLVATDLAARGWDMPEVSHVINLNLPRHDLSFYAHRAGRTGRSGRTGECISIVNDKDRSALDSLKAQGISFAYKRISAKGFEEARPFMTKRSKPPVYDSEVAQILNRKKIKVKPGYKKKRKQELDRLMARRRRQMIKASINEQKKAKNKARSLDQEL